MDAHHKINYALTAALAGCVGYGGWALRSTPSRDELPPTYQVSTGQLRALPLGKHDYTVFVASGSGDLPYALSDAIEAQGGSAKTESDMLPHEGVWISPDTDEGRVLAAALSKAIGEPIKVGNADGGAFEIGVGYPQRKRIAK